MKSQFLFLVYILATCLTTRSAIASTYRTVALSGQPAPGTPAGVVFSRFDRAVLNDTGQVAFPAVLEGSGIVVANSSGVWLEGTNGLTLAARRGNLAPATTNDAVFSGFGSPVLLNGAGQTAFWGTVAGPGVAIGTNHDGIWSGGPESLSLIAQRGNQAPGLPDGIIFGGLHSGRTLNDAGQVAFLAALTGTGVDASNNASLWSNSTGSVSLVARTGGLAPGTTGDTAFASLGMPVLNNTGQVAFVATLAGFEIDSTNNWGIWSEATGELALIARGGTTPPGLPEGVTFGNFGNPVINDQGLTAFNAFLLGEAVDSVNRRTIWAETSQGLTLIARGGQPPPGIEANVVYDLLGAPVLNNSGHLAFTATLSGNELDPAANEAIWLRRNTGLEVVVRKGTQAPGALEGVLFNGFTTTLSLNDANQVAFFATLTGEGVDTSNDRGIWVTDASSLVPKLVVRTGEMIEIGPGEFRTISSFAHLFNFGSSDGRASGFNNRGQFVFGATFTDGTHGVFVSDAALIVPLSGDYNENGVVDAADFTVWRDNLGTSHNLAGNGNEEDDSAGIVDLADYALWKAYFGTTAGPGVGGPCPGPFCDVGSGAITVGANLTNVPEPSGLLLAALGGLTIPAFHARRRIAVLVVSLVIGLSIAGGTDIAAAPPNFPCDFNADGVCDAADYTVWRDNLGAPDESSLNGNGDGMHGVDQGDYELWKTNFGENFAEGSGSAPTLACDYTGDGVCDAADYTVWRQHLGMMGGATTFDGDGTGDGNVTMEDYAFWKDRFGTEVGSGSAVVGPAAAGVPEPASWLLAAAGGLLLSGLCRRRR